MARVGRRILTVVGFSVACAAMAGEYGTKAEAKAMLDKVVSDMEKDKHGTLAKITDRAYNDRDLYPFCSGPDGKVSAHGAIRERIGVDQATLKDSAGKAFGAEIRRVARPSEVSEVSYTYSRPGSKEQAPKISLVTKVDDQVCAVGYYKEQPAKQE